MVHDLNEKNTLNNYLRQVQQQFEKRPVTVMIYNLKEGRDSLDKALEAPGYIVRYEDTEAFADMKIDEYPDLLIHNIDHVDRMDLPFLDHLMRCHEVGIPTIVILPAEDEKTREKLLSMDIEAVIEHPFNLSDLMCRIRNLVRIRRLREWNDMLMKQLTDLLQRRTHDLFDEERQTVIDNMVNGIFHNVRGPLTGLFFACDNMALTVQAMNREKLEDAEQKDIEELDTSVNMIRKALDRMNEMLCKLVDRTEADSRAYPQVVDLNILLTHEIELMKADMEFKHHIRKSIELHPEPLNVKVVRSEIAQSIYSILRNAVEALIDHESPQIDIRTDTADGMANIYIENNGPGISPETRERIFEPFFSTKQNAMEYRPGVSIGKGLGLHFCRQSIRTNDGEIVLESEPDANTRFRIKLPLHRET